jgi:hypothetical protein
MQKIVCVFFFLLVIIPGTFSQQRIYKRTPSYNKFDFDKGTQFVRLNLTNSFDPMDFSISTGYQYHLNEQITVASDAGLYLYSRYYENTKSTFGYQLRPAVRFYTAKQGTFYIELEMMYKQLTHRIHDFIGREANGTVAAYEELTDFKYRRKILGTAAKFGVFTNLDRDKKFFIDIYAGIGLRTKRFKLVNEPNSIYRTDASFFNTDVENTTYPSIPIGVRLAWRIH